MNRNRLKEGPARSIQLWQELIQEVEWALGGPNRSDSVTEETGTAAESDRFRGQTPPIFRRNGPVALRNRWGSLPARTGPLGKPDRFHGKTAPVLKWQRSVRERNRGPPEGIPDLLTQSRR